MAGASKIERMGLQPVIEELISRKITTSTAISDELKKLGHNISQPTVSRYLKCVAEKRKEETKNILSEHISQNLPTDLTAIETMEAQCLAWAKEDKEKFAHRLAIEHINEAAPKWEKLILELNGADPKVKKNAIEEIVDQCLLWISNDFRLQAARLAAMKQAGSFIDMKLRYAMGESADGKIIFLNSEAGDRVEKDENTGKLLVFRGGQD